MQGELRASAGVRWEDGGGGRPGRLAHRWCARRKWTPPTKLPSADGGIAPFRNPTPPPQDGDENEKRVEREAAVPRGDRFRGPHLDPQEREAVRQVLEGVVPRHSDRGKNRARVGRPSLGLLPAFAKSRRRVAP